MAILRTGIFYSPAEQQAIRAQIEACLTNYNAGDTLLALQTTLYQLAVAIHGLPDNGVGFYGMDTVTGEIISGDNPSQNQAQ